jgi:glycosyltransferase involved in cell wall biosynthesis
MSSRPLRILVVHNRYRTGQPSGEDRVVDQEAAVLAGAGHHVTTFERRSDDIASMSIPGKAAVALRVPWSPPSRRELEARLRDERPDIVHLHNTFPLISPAAVAACAAVGIPAVATLHNYWQVCPSGTLYRAGGVCTACTHRLPLPAIRHGCYRGSRVATAPLAVTTLVNRRVTWPGVTRFFCVSGAQRQVLVDAGMPAERLIVKHNFVPDPGMRRAGPGEHVLYLGRMTEDKGLRVLMHAWDRVRASGGLGVPLVLAGTGPLEQELMEWARGRSDVRHLGMLSRARCTDLMSRATAVVAPSNWLETFGLVVVEAMAAAVPAVAPAHGAFTELIRDGVTGLLHRPGDPGSLAAALRRIVDPELNAAMGAAARRCYQHRFSPEVGLAALIAGYEAAICAARLG